MLRVRCTICTEDIKDDAACCPCGHIYHLECLNRWLSQSRTCPTCRKSTSKPVLLFFDGVDLNNTQAEDDADSLRNSIEDLKSLLNQKDLEINCLRLEHKKELVKEKAALQKEKECAVEEVRIQFGKKLQIEKSTTAGLKKQLCYLKEKETELAIARSEASELRAEFLKLKRMKTLIDDHTDDAEAMLHELDSKSFPEVILQLITLKRKLEEKKLKCKQAIDAAEKIKKENILIKNEAAYKEIELTKSQDHLKMAEEDLRRLEKENANRNLTEEDLERVVQHSDADRGC